MSNFVCYNIPTELPDNIHFLKEGGILADNELLQLIYSGMQGLQKDVHEIKVDIADLKDRVTVLENEVKDLKDKVKGLEDGFEDLNRRVRSIETTLENETNRNIKIIAESHLDLSRKLSEAVKVSDAEKAYQVKVNFLESDMRKVKEILNIA